MFKLIKQGQAAHKERSWDLYPDLAGPKPIHPPLRTPRRLCMRHCVLNHLFQDVFQLTSSYDR